MQSGDAVAVKFTATTADGRVVDSSDGPRGPAYFVVHEGAPRVPGLDTALGGLAPGATARAGVKAADAFGERSDDNIIRVPGLQAPAVRPARSGSRTHGC